MQPSRVSCCIPLDDHELESIEVIAAWCEAQSHLQKPQLPKLVPQLQHQTVHPDTHLQQTRQVTTATLATTKRPTQLALPAERAEQPAQVPFNSELFAQDSTLTQPVHTPFSPTPLLPRHQRSRSQTSRDSLSVLLREYNSMMNSQQAAPNTPAQPVAEFDKPKGLAKLFVALCLPADKLNLLFRLLSHLLMMSLVVVVPLWLALVRWLYVQGQAKPACILGVLGPVVFYIAEAVSRPGSALKDGPVTAANKESLQLTPPAPYFQMDAQDPGTPTGAAAAAAGGSNGPSAAAKSKARSSAMTPKEEAVLKFVKTQIIKLEQFAYGRELSEGDIPRDQLVQRVANLSEELGFAFERDKVKTLEDLSRVLIDGIKHVGLVG